MWRKLLAICGGLLFLAGLILFTAEFALQQQGLPPGTPARTMQNSSALIIAGSGLLLGPLLTLPWWRRRFREEDKWWQKRDEPIEGPPRVPT